MLETTLPIDAPPAQYQYRTELYNGESKDWANFHFEWDMMREFANMSRYNWEVVTYIPVDKYTFRVVYRRKVSEEALQQQEEMQVTALKP